VCPQLPDTPLQGSKENKMPQTNQKMNVTDQQLSNLPAKQRAVIHKCLAQGPLKAKLMNMGFVPGVEVTMVRNAPLRDPLEISIQNYLVTLRRAEAALIEVAPL
jgi:Fe2+ transport system protein FeoA